MQNCVFASFCVSVSTLLYRHQWHVCILSQTYLHCIRFMLLMWAFVHDVSLWVWAVTMVTQEIGRLKWWCHHTDCRYHFLDPKGKETLCQLDLLLLWAQKLKFWVKYSQMSQSRINTEPSLIPQQFSNRFKYCNRVKHIRLILELNDPWTARGQCFRLHENDMHSYIPYKRAITIHLALCL